MVFMLENIPFKLQSNYSLLHIFTRTNIVLTIIVLTYTR